MAIETVVAAEAPVAEVGGLLPARPVDLRKAVRLGLYGGITAVFVSAIGMVREFSARDVLDELSLGTALLLAIPFVIGLTAGRPPAQLQGFAPTQPGWRNVAGGLAAGLLTGAVMVAFVVLIRNINLREYFINLHPDLVEGGPRLLLYGRSLGPGLGLVLVLNAAMGGAGGALHHLGTRWRRAVLAGALAIVAFALLQPFVEQVLRGIDSEWGIDTGPLARFLYRSGSLRIPAAVVIALATFGLHLWSRRPGRTPLRARVERLPTSQRRTTTLGALAVGAVVAIVLPSILGSFLSQVFALAGIFVLMALGLNIVLGFAGLLDLGYVAFFAVGAYTTGVLTSPTGGLEVGWIIWAAVPFVLLAAAVAGIMVGTPVLRMRGDYLAIVTLGFGEITRLLFASDWLSPTFGGAQGVTQIADISIGPWEVRGPESFLYPLLVLILLAAYVSYALQRSRVGRAWMAMREDESVAEAVGVNIVAAKLSAFIVGAILAGLGGALFATQIGSIFPSSFEIEVSIVILVAVIVGGMASVPGVMLGALVLVGLPELLREFEEFRFLLYGALLIFMMLRRPEGFIPSRRRAQELHEADIAQDAWLRARAGASADGETEGGAVVVREPTGR
jgi:branched-chain amino acid transport system permease protein